MSWEGPGSQKVGVKRPGSTCPRPTSACFPPTDGVLALSSQVVSEAVAGSATWALGSHHTPSW